MRSCALLKDICHDLCQLSYALSQSKQMNINSRSSSLLQSSCLDISNDFQAGSNVFFNISLVYTRMESSTDPPGCLVLYNLKYGSVLEDFQYLQKR